MKKIFKVLTLINLIFVLGVLSGCSHTTEAEEVLKDSVLTQVRGDGPQQITFKGNTMLVSNDGLTPEIEDPADVQEPELKNEYSKISFKDEDGNWLVMHNKKQILSFKLIKKDGKNILEDNFGNQYLIENTDSDKE